jgi:hypothetical protein
VIRKVITSKSRQNEDKSERKMDRNGEENLEYDIGGV